MKTIEWREELNIGIPEIDAQHQRLVGMINTLASNPDPGNVFDTVMQMAKYADEHFAVEEELMLRCGCDQLNKHKEQHHIFRQKTTELAGEDYTSGKHQLDAFFYLCEWFINHILTVDMKYKYCFLEASGKETKKNENT